MEKIETPQYTDELGRRLEVLATTVDGVVRYNMVWDELTPVGRFGAERPSEQFVNDALELRFVPSHRGLVSRKDTGDFLFKTRSTALLALEFSNHHLHIWFRGRMLAQEVESALLVEPEAPKKKSKRKLDS